MLQRILFLGQRLLHSLSFKLSFSVGLITFLAVAAGAWWMVQRQGAYLEERFQAEAAGFVETVRRATYYSMLQNQRENLHRIISDVGQQPGVEAVRVFNKEGLIMFSSRSEEIGREVDMKAEACYGCHAADTPLTRLPLTKRTRIFSNDQGHRVMGRIRPIYNEPICSGPPCHAHPPDRKVLGVLDVDLDLHGLDLSLRDFRWRTVAFAGLLFIAVSTIIGVAVILTVNRSVRRLEREIDKVGGGEEALVEEVQAPDELGRLARAVERMAQSVAQRTRARERSYRLLVDNSTDAVIVLDAAGRMLMANPEAGRILGSPDGELIGRDARKLIEASDLAQVDQALAGAREQDQASEILRFQVRALDGRWKVVEGRFRRLPPSPGGLEGVLCNLRDITQRRELESALERHRLFEQSLLSHAINALIATDQEGVVQVFNRSAEELLGMSAESVVGRMDYGRLFARAQAGLIRKRLFVNPRPGAILERPAVVKTSSGRRLPVRMVARTLFLEGDFSGLMFHLQNMRESKALKAQLLKKTRLAAVGETTAGLAHCIKNLMHGLGSASHIVDQGLKDGDLELAGQGWRMVRLNLDRVDVLTQDLLAYAKDRRPQYQPFSLNELLAECRSLVAGRAADLGGDHHGAAGRGLRPGGAGPPGHAAGAAEPGEQQPGRPGHGQPGGRPRTHPGRPARRIRPGGDPGGGQRPGHPGGGGRPAAARPVLHQGQQGHRPGAAGLPEDRGRARGHHRLRAPARRGNPLPTGGAGPGRKPGPAHAHGPARILSPVPGGCLAVTRPLALRPPLHKVRISGTGENICTRTNTRTLPRPATRPPCA